ncbi:MAG: ATPase [Proteobacteria bacterium]|nr:MAG: ATPase [Pseudomonadota bacterium]PIE19917.1 MAG: ATPase [Pseudomonadota bacterium]
MPPTASYPHPYLAAQLQETARSIDRMFLDKQEIIRLMIVSVLAGEHMVLVGPPGTAKSALIRALARLIDANYFEYLLTRFTEPNEIFGPVDMMAFRSGEYRRRVDGMLPEAEIVFLDEVFKANSAILNSLLTLLNERRYANGRNVLSCPLLSVFGASNEVPNDDDLHAIFDRFLLRVQSDNLDSYHFANLVQRGVAHEIAQLTGNLGEQQALLSAEVLHSTHRSFASFMRFSEAFITTYKGLIFQIRSEGISVSDRRVVKLTKLFAASAIFDGRTAPCDADFFVLKHIWNNLDQVEILAEIVSPVIDRYYREHPEERRFIGPTAGLDELLAELEMIRDLLTTGQDLSDIQLFSQLKNLNEIKSALVSIDNETARRMVSQVDQLLDSVFSSSKFA